MTSKIKLIWKVSEPPTGRYRSFEERAWPSADYPDGKTAAIISCEHAYVPSKVRSGQHGPLTVRVADWSAKNAGTGTWQWRKMKMQFTTLAEAKAGAVACIAGHPEFQPKEQP